MAASVFIKRSFSGVAVAVRCSQPPAAQKLPSLTPPQKRHHIKEDHYAYRDFIFEDWISSCLDRGLCLGLEPYEDRPCLGSVFVGSALRIADLPQGATGLGHKQKPPSDKTEGGCSHLVWVACARCNPARRRNRGGKGKGSKAEGDHPTCTRPWQNDRIASNRRARALGRSGIRPLAPLPALGAAPLSLPQLKGG